MRVLIIEDNVSNAEMLNSIFLEEGFETLTSYDGLNLWQHINDFKPQAVLIDILLRYEDGRDICNLIKNNSDTAHKVVVLMTAGFLHNLPEIETDPDYLVVKPFDVYALTSKVRYLIHGSNTDY